MRRAELNRGGEIGAHAHREIRQAVAYGDLRRQFSDEEIIDLCFVIGLSNLVNRFHATFLTDLDDRTTQALGGSCPLSVPPQPDGG